MKISHILSVITIVFLLHATAIAQDNTNDTQAQTALDILRDDEAGKYFNKYIGLSFYVPERWYIAAENEAIELMPDAARAVGLDDPVAKETVAQMPGKVLLITSLWPLSSDGNDANPNIIIAAINARDIAEEVDSGADYLKLVAKGMNESQQFSAVSDVTTQSLGDEEFYCLNAMLIMQDTTVHISQLARIHNDYIVILNISASSANDLKKLIRIADNNLSLSTVSSELDDSPEGILFREKSSLKMPDSSAGSSSGGNLLQTLGLILMIGGGLLFLKNLLR